ncbi:MAG: alginate export family protein [Armatimonadota bacterium]|nr:alginate export family protein [Armatimonadota bacterium]
MLTFVALSTPAQAAAATPAPAPTGAPTAASTAPTPTATPIKIGNMTLTGSWRLRAEHWNWFETPGFEDSYTFGASLLRVGLGQGKPKHDWQVEIAQPTLVNLPDNAIAPAPLGVLGHGANYFAANQKRNDAGIFVKQAFFRFKGIGSSGATSVRLGRFEFNEGTEVIPKDPTLAWLKNQRIAARLLGNFAYTHVQRSFDGAQFVHNTPKLNVTALATRPTEGVFQVDGNGELDIDVLYGSVTRPLASGEGRVFALHYRDDRPVAKTGNTATTGDVEVTTLGADYLKTFAVGEGKADLLLWGAFQIGDWGPLDHKANAIALEAGYQPKSPKLKPWLRVGYFRGTGDKNATDGEHGTFFTNLNTPRVYARYPFYNMMNNEDLFAQLILRPNPKLSLRTEVHSLRLNKATDLWYVGGGAFQDGSFGYAGRPSGGIRNLATLFDVSADYTINPQNSLGLYLALARGRGVISNIYPAGKNSHLAYVEYTRRF